MEFCSVKTLAADRIKTTWRNFHEQLLQRCNYSRLVPGRKLSQEFLRFSEFILFHQCCDQIAIEPPESCPLFILVERACIDVMTDNSQHRLKHCAVLVSCC